MLLYFLHCSSPLPSNKFQEKAIELHFIYFYYLRDDNLRVFHVISCNFTTLFIIYK